MNIEYFIAEQNALLFREVKKICRAINALLNGACEIVVTDGEEAKTILFIENPSGRYKIGASLPMSNQKHIVCKDIQKVEDVDIIAKFRRVDLHLRNSRDEIPLCLCLEVNLTRLKSLNIAKVMLVGNHTQIREENVRAMVLTAIKEYTKLAHIDGKNTQKKDRKEIIKHLKKVGVLETRGAVKVTAEILNMTRATIYNTINKKPE
ncbi:helix-turn-helix domain-containing protein [Serratia marcescens]|uniref:helix-turn-helix domain-containing protein n=1 Tax=Serratia marcescens TaxID=615 RepID=UPI00313C9602